MMANMTKNIIILGSGVIGVTTAYYLAEKGHSVTVIDKASEAGMGASFANGAQLSYSKTYPLSSLSTLAKIPKLMFAKDSPIHIHTGFDLDFFKWGGQFVRQCFKAEANSKKVLDIALSSRAEMHKLIQRHEINFDYERTGKIFLFSDKYDFETHAKGVEGYNKLGFNQKVMSPDEIIDIEPALSDMKGQFVGAVYSPLDESGDAKKFSSEMVRISKELGVKYVFDAEINQIKTSNGKIIGVEAGGNSYEADIYIVCLGVEAPHLMREIGISLPIYPMKGYSLTMKATGKAPKISITDEARKVVYSKIGDRLRVAGVAEFAGYNKDINRKIVDSVIDAAKTCFPNAADYSEITEWTGLRPMTPSTVPITGKSKKFDNLYFNTGHGMLGWTLALGSAKKIAESIV